MRTRYFFNYDEKLLKLKVRVTFRFIANLFPSIRNRAVQSFFFQMRIFGFGQLFGRLIPIEHSIQL